MMDKFINILKEGNITFPKQLLYNYKKLNLSEKELIVLIYLINYNDGYNPKKIGLDLNMEFKDILEIVSELSNKGILKIELKTINNIKEEYINLDMLYEKIAYILIDKKEETSSDIYDNFEKEFGRTLSSMEYEIISSWLENDYQEEIILLALKEAVYNGVTNLRYIDKILFEWNKKGIKTKEDVEKEKNNFKNKKIQKQELFDYDWLNEDE